MNTFGQYAMALVATLIAFVTSGQSAVANEIPENSGWPTGTWYLALDTEIYGLPPGFPLSGMAQIHRDGTLTIVDGGDFGQAEFLNTRNLPQYGSWRRAGGGTIEATTLFLEADAASGDVLRWIRVEFALWRDEAGVTLGTVNTTMLPCAPALPPPSPLSCPDPIDNADLFVPVGDPPDVPVTLKRLLPVP
jgi:hypothetical protein